MGTLTLENFRDELRFDLENRTDFDESDPTAVARMNRWINTAYEHVSFPNIHKHWELEDKITIPLVADQFEYPIDTGQTYIDREILGFRAVRFVNGAADSYTADRHQVVPRGLAYMNSTKHTTSRPSTYAVYRKKIVFSPGPNAEFNGKVAVCEVWVKPDAMIDGETTVLLDFWDEVILIGALWLALNRLGDHGEAMAVQSRYAALINEAPDRYLVGGEEETGYVTEVVNHRTTPAG